MAHLSLELGHPYLEDFEARTERLEEHLSDVRFWADAARASTVRRLGLNRPGSAPVF
ncbi:hypothetical protein ABTY96_28900 [Streptomyces sp. NPDC096057]|uniref:hypothetical protein n=1 Tax=Streptomyces sp. NPDC096057 TaxID=3155543 RepID=UPI0033282B86